MEIEVYCDESGPEHFSRRPQEPGTFVLIGSLWIPAEKRSDYKHRIGELRNRHALHGEFKWNRVSPSRLDFYMDAVRLFFGEKDMRFRCIVLPADQLDATTFHEADNELMFYKFYYQVLHHWILDFNKYRVFTDVRTNRTQNRLKTLESCLDSSNLTSSISVQALPSEQVDLLQLVDVLLGAVAYHYHGGESPAKSAVVEEVKRGIGREIHPTPRDELKFNVFQFRPGGGW
jgi:hypothetical protein